MYYIDWIGWFIIRFPLPMFGTCIIHDFISKKIFRQLVLNTLKGIITLCDFEFDVVYVLQPALEELATKYRIS